MEFVNFVNVLFENSSLVKNLDFQMKSFSIIPLCTRLNLSEWVNETATLKSIIEREWRANGMKLGHKEIFDKYNIKESIFNKKICNI